MNATSSRPGQKRLRSTGIASASSSGGFASIANQPLGSHDATSCTGSFDESRWRAATRSIIAFASHGRSAVTEDAVERMSASVVGEGVPDPSSSSVSVNSAMNARGPTPSSTRTRPSTIALSTSLSASTIAESTALRIAREPMSRRNAASRIAPRSGASSAPEESTACTRTSIDSSSIALPRRLASVTLSATRSAARSV